MIPARAGAAAAAVAPRVRWLSAALLALATLAAFGGVVRNEWILFDDPLYVYANPHVRGGFTLEGVTALLREPHGGNWHPLTSLSHVMDVQLFGLDPHAHHAVSLVLHVVNAVLLLLVLDRLTGAWWRSLAVAALFALHPLRVESVAWISERKDVLSGFWFLLSVGAYARWVESPRPARYAWLVAAVALGLLSKPMLVTLPLVLLLLDAWPLGRIAAGPRTTARGAAAAPRTTPGIRRLLLEKAPLFALALALAVVTVRMQHASGAMVSIENAPLARRLGNALVSYWRYLGKLVWPAGLAPFYPNDRAPDPGVVTAAAAGLAIVTALAIAAWRRRPYLAVGWLWYLVMLLPVIGIVQVGGQAYADRYTYLPALGITIAAVWGLADLAGTHARARHALIAAGALALTMLAVATFRQVARWHDTATLFTHTLAVTRDNAVAHRWLGDALMITAGPTPEAIQHYREAARIAPDLFEAHNKLAVALDATGHEAEAIDEFRAALRLRPLAAPRLLPEKHAAAELHHNLGFALARTGRIDEAIPEFQAALELEPDHALSLLHLGMALGAKGRRAESRSLLLRAVEVAPDSLEPRRMLAELDKGSGDVAGMIDQYERLLRRSPDDLDALVNVAWVRATHPDPRLRDGAEALRLAERARARSGQDMALIEATLAAALAERGEFADAAAAGERAVALARAEHDHEGAARYALQLALYRAGKPYRISR